MKKIGMIVAVEMQAVHKRYGEPKEIRVIHNQKVYVYDRHEFELYVIHWLGSMQNMIRSTFQQM